MEDDSTTKTSRKFLARFFFLTPSGASPPLPQFASLLNAGNTWLAFAPHISDDVFVSRSCCRAGCGWEGGRRFGGEAGERTARSGDREEDGYRREGVHPHPLAGLSPPDQGVTGRVAAYIVWFCFLCCYCCAVCSTRRSIGWLLGRSVLGVCD